MQFVQTNRLKEISLMKNEIKERINLQMIGGLLLDKDDPELKDK